MTKRKCGKKPVKSMQKKGALSGFAKGIDPVVPKLDPIVPKLTPVKSNMTVKKVWG